MAHRSLDLCTADPFHGQCGVLHIYDSCTDTQEKKDAGNDGCYRYAAIRKIYSCWRIAPLLQRSGHTFCNALNHLIIYSRTFWTDNCDLFNLSYAALANNYIPTENLLIREEENTAMKLKKGSDIKTSEEQYAIATDETEPIVQISEGRSIFIQKL